MRRPVAAAREAEARRDWSTALALWNAVRTDFPDASTGYLGVTLALRQFGHFDEAEAMIAEAVERLPDRADIRIGWAALAHGRRLWEEAARRWREVRANFPQEAAGYVLG